MKAGLRLFGIALFVTVVWVGYDLVFGRPTTYRVLDIFMVALFAALVSGWRSENQHSVRGDDVGR